MINKLEFAKTIVKEAGSYLREHLHDQLAITVKTNPTDLVTQMDQEVQATLVRKILKLIQKIKFLLKKMNFVLLFTPVRFG